MPLFGSPTTIIEDEDGDGQQPAKPAPPPAQIPTRTEPAPDPLDQAILENIRRRDAAEATRMRGAAVQADAVTPDRAARTKQIERQTGVPYAIVDRNWDELDRRARIDAVPYGQVQTQTPALAQWASDPANAAIAKDDMERLGFLEWLLKAPERFWQRKDAQDRVSEIRSKQVLFGVGALTRAERDALWVEQQYAKETSRFGAGDTWWSPRGLVAGTVEFTQNTVGMLKEAGPYAAAGAVGGALAGAAAGATAGSVIPGAGTAAGAWTGAVQGGRYGFGAGMTVGSAKRGFTLEAGGALDEFLDPQWQKDFGQPMDEDTARAAALAAGVINAGIESVQFSRILKSFPALGKLQGVFTRNAIKQALRNPTVRTALKDVMLNYGKTLTFETGTEVGQRAVTILAGEMGKWVDGNGATMRGQGEWSEELWQEAVGALQTFAVGVAAGPATGLARDVGRARRAQAYQGLFNALAEGVSDSPSVKRAPESVQEFIKAATKDGPVEHVYIDEDKFSEYFQSINKDPATVAAELTGNPNALAEARTTGEAIAIPTAVYGTMVAGTEHHAALAGDLRIGPEGPAEMTPKEATALREALVASQKAQAEQEQAAADGQPAGPPTPRQTLGDLFRGIGVSEKRTAAYAHYLSNIFVTLAQRAQVDPQTLFRRYGLRMERPGYAPATQTQEPETGAAPPPGGEPPPGGPGVTPSAASPAGPATVPDSVLSAFPDMAEAEGGLLPLARFTGEEQAALEAAGLVREATTSDGTTYRGVDPAKLWPLRQARAAEGTTREPQLTPEGEASLARRRAAAGVESPDAAAAAVAPPNEPAAPAETAAGAELPGGPAESVAAPQLGLQPGAGEAAGAEARATDRLPPSTRHVFAELLSDAVAHGYTGTDQDLADQFLEHYERARVVAADLEEISHDNSWRQILVEISKFGGINPAKEGKGGFQGEVEWLMEGLRWGSGVIRRGRRAGQIMPVQSAGLRGGGGLVPAPGIVVRKGGHSLDTVREHLQQDPRWSHLDNLTDLLVILEDAVIKGHGENAGEVVTVGSSPSVWSTLEGLFGVKPGEQWWTNRDEGDTSFNPDEFFQRLFGTPLFDLVDQDVADEAARVEADAVAELPPPAVVPVPEAIVLPPPGELLTRTDYNASLRTTYVDEAGTPRAQTSRVDPQTAAIPPVGTWMLEDTYPLMDGHEIEQLVELPIDAIEISEDTGAARFGDVARFARWMLEGKEPPPIRVVQTDKGTLKTLDHRRLLAAKAVGATTIKAWVSWATVSPREGNPITGLTRELALQGAGPIAVVPADPERTIFRDDARRLEALRAELAAPPAADVLDTGEVQPRLPGAETVREQDAATPEFEAPFSLTAPVDTSTRGTQTELFQAGDPRAELRAEVDTFVEGVKAEHPDLRELDIHVTSAGNLDLSTLAVTRGAAGGTGTAVMQAITDFADQRGLRLELSPAAKGFQPGDEAKATTSTGRLVRFYQLFGFVKNTGRNKDFTTRRAMIRAPQGVGTGPTAEQAANAARVYLARGAGHSTTRMLQALRDVGYRFGALQTSAQKRAALALVTDLIDQAEAPLEQELFQTELPPTDAPPAPSFYSRLVRAVESSPQGRATGAQWKATITHAKIGISTDEYQFVDVDDLEDAQTYTQAEVLEYLRLNQVHVEEVTLGSPIDRAKIDELADRLRLERVDAARERAEPPDMDLDLGRISIDELTEEEHGEAGFRLTIDGEEIGVYDTKGEAEEEVVRREASWRDDMERQWWDAWEYEQQQAYTYDDAWQDAKAQLEEETPSGAEQSIVRHTEYQVPGGIPGSYREAFLTNPPPPAVAGEPAATRPPVRPTWNDGHDEYWFVDNPIVRIRYDFRHDAEGHYILFVHELQPPQPAEQAKMPRLFVQNWRELGLKYALKLAVENGAKRVAVAEVSSGSEADAAIDERNRDERKTRRDAYSTVPSIEVTPAVREKVLEGQAYFQSPHDTDAGPTELGQPERQRPAGVKGSVRFDPSKRFTEQRELTLSLFEGHDASTVIHESAHIFLEVMQDLAQTSPAIAADLAVLKAWAHDPDTSGPVLSEYQHEQIAIAFETYVMDGRAPSVELRGVFAHMRAWMLDVYRAVKGGLVPGLDRKVNDEVRAVFDRLLASDEAIAEARRSSHVVPIFLTPDAAGMSATEFELYRRAVQNASTKAREGLDRELLAEVRREQSDTWKDRREEERAKVEAEVNATPVYRALAAMQRGETPEGQPLSDPHPGPQRLSRAIVSAQFGQDLVKQLPRSILTSKEGGLDPAVVAETFGFTSADHLLQAILASPPRQELIDHETDERMKALFPSLLDDEVALEQAAQAALADESRDRVIRAELRALTKLRRTAQPFQQAARTQQRRDAQQAARERAYERRWFEAEARLRVAMAEGAQQAEIDALKDELSRLRAQVRGSAVRIREAIPDTETFRVAAVARIAGTRLADLNPQLFWSAATKASRKATEAAARGDVDGAIAAKHQELLNLALFREARRVQQDTEKRLRWVRETQRPAARQRLGKAGETYLDQVDQILERFEFKPVSRKDLRRRANIVNWIGAMEGEGLPVDLPAILVEEAFRTHYTELTVQQFTEVTDGLKQIVHLARLKNRLLKNKQQRDLAQLTATLIASVEDHVTRKVTPPARDRRPSEARRYTWGEFFASHRKLASLLRELDGWIDGGPMWDAIMRPLNDAGARETEMQAAATQAMHELVERAFPGREKTRLYQEMLVPEVGESLSRMARIMVAMNWGNEGNRDRIRRGNGWSDAQVHAILDTLSAGDLQFVQGALDFINSYWTEIAAKAQRVNGMPPVKVDAVEIVAANGTIPGGYFPLKYDDRRSASAIMALDLEAAHVAKHAAATNATTKHGHEQARAATVNIPVRLDFGVMFEHVQAVIHDLSHHEVLLDLGRILGQRDLQQTILDNYGDIFYKQIRNTLRDIAFGDVPAATGVERVLNHLRTGATIAGLGWNFVTAALQPLGLANTWARIGGKWTLKGVGRWIRNPTSMVETVHWINARSEFMRSRGRTMQREINEVRQQFGIETGKFSGFVEATLSTVSFDTVTKQGISDSYFRMIQVMQMVVDVPTWLGMYEKAMAAGESEERAIALADQAVLDSQGGGQIKDLCQAQRGTPALKLWTNFYSFFNVLHQQAVEVNRRSGNNPVELGRKLVDYTILFIVPASLSFLLKAMFRGGFDEDDEPDDIALKLFYENIGYAMGTMLYLRDVGGFVAGNYGWEGPAGSRAFADISKFATQAKQFELDAAFWEALAKGAGVLLHWPTGQAAKSADGIAALAEGETTNPLAVVGGGPR